MSNNFKVSKNYASLGTNIKHNPLEIKTVRYGSSSSSEDDRETSEDLDKTPEQIRSERREEYREANNIRSRALEMQKKAEQRLKETEQFSSLIEQAKEDPSVFAKVLNISPEEFQRKLFNKTFSIKEDPIPTREETKEEKIERRLALYEQQLNEDRSRKQQEALEESARRSERVKHEYVRDNILPCINETHEFLNKENKEVSANFVYDFMNQAFNEFLANNPNAREEDFPLKASDVVDQMEEELAKSAEEQILAARSISKLKKYFSSDMIDEKGEIARKDFSIRRETTTRPTLSRSFGGISSSSGGEATLPQRKIPLSNRDARRAYAKRQLGS